MPLPPVQLMVPEGKMMVRGQGFTFIALSKLESYDVVLRGNNPPSKGGTCRV